MNKCISCESTSVILDGRSWVCAEHITPCRCEQNHSVIYDWDFQHRTDGIPYTIGAMEAAMPTENTYEDAEDDK